MVEPSWAVNLSVTKTVDNPTPKAGDYVTFTIVVENLEKSEESAGTLLTDDMSVFEDVMYRYRMGYWAGNGSNRYYTYEPSSYTSWSSWPGMVTLGWMDRWRKKEGGKGGRYEIQIRAKVKESLAGREIVNTAKVKKDDFESSATASIYVREEPWAGGEVFTPYYKPIPTLYDTSMQPNVLLLLDTSGSMTFNMQDDESTYGDGSKPVTYGFSSPQFYYGKDTDPSNNDPNVERNYHPNLKYVSETEVELIKQNQGEWALTYLGYDSASSQYLYPNDSRMYQMKVVLNNIFSDEQLIYGLRVALATYDQEYSSGGSLSDWYKFPRLYYGGYYYYYGGYYYEDQYLHYRTGEARALLRENFASIDDPSHLEALLKWFDGVEENGNPELRAQGATPLAASIYGHNGYSWNSSIDSAVKFFKASGVIQGWCQKNYLIVLTDGADNGPGDPVEAVRRLYDEAKKSSWPQFFGRKAYPVKTLVIGLIDPDSMPDLAEELNEMADYGWDGTEGNADPTDDPFDDGDPGAYFATNIDELLAAFREIFSIIQTDQITGGAPLVSPTRTDVGGGAVYVASFLPQEYSQWKGHLYKYSLVSGDIGDSPEWDAAEELERIIEENSRVVCTIDWEGSSASKPSGLGSGTNFVRVSPQESSTLADEISPEGVTLPEAYISKFIQWINGYDAWGETAGNVYRSAFADIYHGGVTEVGPPSANYPSTSYYNFAQEHKTRDKVLYAQSNAGVLHAIDPDSGEEKWAFIPPNVLARGRLLGLKAYYGSDNMKLLDEAISVPRYLLDGPLIAEDVVLPEDEQWGTVLVGCLGYGGNGMYALDITDPNEPRFLWAVENNMVSPNGSALLPEESRKVHYWKKGASGSKIDYETHTHQDVSDDSDLDYKKLYRTLSTPLLGYLDSLVYNEQTNDWEGRWVAVIGNGHPGDFADTLTDGVIYVLDIGTGKIIKKLEAEGKLGPVCAPITGFSSSLSSGVVDHIYAADVSGNIFEWSVNDRWGQSLQIFDSQSTNGGIIYRMDVGLIDHDPWLFYEIGDAEGLSEEATSYRLYAVNTTAAGEDDPLTIGDLEQVTPDGNDTSDNAEGWYMDFATDPLERPSTPVLFYNGYLLFCTFEDSTDPCELGITKIYIVNAETGEGAWKNNAKYVEVSGIHVSGITVFDGKVYLGVSGFATEEYLSSVLGEGVDLGRNLLSFTLPEGIPNTPEEGAGTTGGLLFWREWR
jgi:type IV pilus assembly protein PilY1